jgi:uncharacterized protein (TIGR02145 family)
MAENLRTTKLNDGTIIPNLSDDSIWVKLQTAGLCWYNNDSARFQKFYGPLYNFYAVNTSQLCPIGWHVPDKSFSMSCYDTHLNRFEIHKREGLNVRCIDFASLLM